LGLNNSHLINNDSLANTIFGAQGFRADLD